MEIFISYSRQDGSRVREVVSALGRDGFNVWIDREGITGGNDFVERIVRALSDCKVVVFFSSESSNASPWTRQEISLAREYDRPIIPVRLDMTPYIPTAAFYLSGVQYVDMTDPSKMEKGIASLEKSLRGILGPVEKPDQGLKSTPSPSEASAPWQEYRRRKGFFSRKFGYVDASGKTVIRAIYDDADECFQGGYAAVAKNGKWGCIDAKGTLVVPMEFEVAPSYLGDDAFAVRKVSGYGIRTKNAHYIVPCDYYTVSAIAPKVYLLKRKDGSFLLSDREGRISDHPFWPVGLDKLSVDNHHRQMLVTQEKDYPVYVDPEGQMVGLDKCAVIFLDDLLFLYSIDEVNTEVYPRVFARAKGHWGELEVPWCHSEKDVYMMREKLHLSGPKYVSILAPFSYNSIAALRRDNG